MAALTQTYSAEIADPSPPDRLHDTGASNRRVVQTDAEPVRRRCVWETTDHARRDRIVHVLTATCTRVETT